MDGRSERTLQMSSSRDRLELRVYTIVRQYMLDSEISTARRESSTVKTCHISVVAVAKMWYACFPDASAIANGVRLYLFCRYTPETEHVATRKAVPADVSW